MTKQEKYQFIDSQLLDQRNSDFIESFSQNIFQKCNFKIYSKNKDIKNILEYVLKDKFKIILQKVIKTLCTYGDCYVHLNIEESKGIDTINLLSPHYIDATFLENNEKSFKCNFPFNKNVKFENFEILHFTHQSVFDKKIQNRDVSVINKIYIEYNLEYFPNEILKIVKSQLEKLFLTHLISLGYKGDEASNFEIFTTEEYELYKLILEEDTEKYNFEKSILERLKNIEVSIENLTKLDASKIGQILNVNK